MATNDKKINILFVLAGSLFVIIGTAGIFVPMLPTTPFLLLAAACYAKGSEKLYEKLVQSRILGEYIRNYREGRGIPLLSKIFAILLLWLSIGSSVFFFVDSFLLQIALLLIAIGVTIHILSIKIHIENNDNNIAKDNSNLDYQDE